VIQLVAIVELTDSPCFKATLFLPICAAGTSDSDSPVGFFSF